MTMVTSFPGSEPRINIANRTVSRNSTAPAGATATYVLNSDGTVRNHLGTILENWIVPGALGGQYEARVTVTSGSLSSGSGAGSWLALSSTRSWSRSQSGDGTSECIITVEIRLAASGVVKDSATVTLSATVSPA